MEIPVRTQLVQAAAGFLAGGAAGLVWDILRFLRRRMPRPLGNAAGLAGLLVIATFLFVVGQGIGTGMRLFFLSACALGWAVCLWGLGGTVGGIFARLDHLRTKCIKKQQKIQ